MKKINSIKKIEKLIEIYGDCLVECVETKEQFTLTDALYLYDGQDINVNILECVSR
jgi:hypothetical protein